MTTQREKEIKMFGCTIEDLETAAKAWIEEGRTIDRLTMSVLSDAQELMDVAGGERSRQLINQVKYLIDKYLAQEPERVEVHKGFTREELQRAFDQLANPKDWRAPIGPVNIPRDKLDLASAAVEFFTATEVKVVVDWPEAEDITIEATGYRAGPAGDH